ncbi:ABC transporter ATP-binding protein [Aspergillus stella-maris]|uniref:ABC transporter ATP-binding protein n=1 Tax=Aspergillus stella-maris TaxID=1810926 RepID=UPI003CCCD7FC
MAAFLKNLKGFVQTPLLNFTTRQHVLTITVAIVCCFIASFTTPLFSVFLGQIFTEFTLRGAEEISDKTLIHNVSKGCIQLLALGALAWFFNAIYYVLFNIFSELQAASARSRIFEALLKKDQKFFEEHEEGARTYLGCLQIQIQELQTATSLTLALILQYLFRILVSLGLAFYTSWILTLVILAGIPIVSLIVPFLAPKINAAIEAQQNELKSASKVVNSAATSIDTVKCLNAQGVEQEKFSHGVDKAATQYLRQALFNSLQISAMRFFMFAMFVQGFWYGSHLVTTGKLDGGEVLRTFWACSMAAQSKGKVAGAALKNVLYQKVGNRHSRDMQGGLYPTHCEGDIEVSKVSFSYPTQPDQLSLDSSTFFFPAGVTTFTLALNWIRNNITYVDQRSILFNESIYKSIAFGRSDYKHIPNQDMEESVNLAMFSSVIEKLPHGIDTPVGEGGNSLSGGQKQRVAIARARLRDTPILIMDEPTSALDGANRVQVMHSIRKWREGKTTIVITHDMSHIKDKDYVYVMDKGNVVQSGYKGELMKESKLGTFFHKDQSDEDWRDQIYDGFSDSSVSSEDKSPMPPLPAKYAHVRNFSLPRNSIGLVRHSEDDEYFEPNTFATEAEVEMDDIKTRIKRKLKRNKEPKAKTPALQEPIRMALRSVIPNLSHKQRLFLFLAFLCVLAHASATPIFSYFLSRLLQTFYNGKNESSKWALAVLGVAIGDAFTNYFMYYLLDICGQAWVDRLRKQAFQRVLNQAKTWFEDDRNTVTQLTTCLHESGEGVRSIVTRFSQFILVALTVTVMAVVCSLALCWKVTLVALSCGPVIYAITQGFEKTSGTWDRRSTAARASASEVFLETFSEIRTVRSLTLERYFHLKHLKAASLCLKVGLRKAMHTGSLFGLIESMTVFVSALIFYYGATLVGYGEFRVDDIMSVNSVLLFSIAYASTVLTWIPQINNSREMARRLFCLTNLHQTSHEHAGFLKPSKAAPININHLNFTYPSRPDAPVLRNISTTIRAGSCTAIVGRSGSGKSTIASLLLSLYKTPSASHNYHYKPAIKVGGIDIRNLDTPALRTLISVVPQQPMIFPGTIQENIAYGLDPFSPLATLFNVRSAARAAGIDDFITSSPRGYETVIGDGGIGLSGGQAQRVDIARALVRRPQTLILDEATSALDPNSAVIIKQTIKRLVVERSGLTVLIITHAREMMEGRVIEEGGFKQLSRKSHGKLRGLIERPEESDEE